MKGQQGLLGMKGEPGIVGNPGRKGEKGEKGESVKASQASVVPQTNWKQCVWKSYSDTDNGKIKVIRIRIIRIITHSKENSFFLVSCVSRETHNRQRVFRPLGEEVPFIGYVGMCCTKGMVF